MAGPGIRYHYMAEELSRNFDVTVGFFDPTYLPADTFKRNYNIKHIDAYTFQPGFEGMDIVISLWLNDSMMNYCNQSNIFMVFDVYAPVPVESLASLLYSGKQIQKEKDFEYKRSLEMYRKFFENGDLFLFSNQRQLDYWTGYVFGADQVRPSTYDARPFYDRFIYAPMGIDANQSLKPTRSVMKGVIKGIAKDDKVMVWTGGIWGWYDGQILMRAMKHIAKSDPHIKLVFFGTQHPNPDVPEMQESFDTRKLAASLGILDKNVFFLDGWVAYHDRINYLVEADVAINTHKPSIETEFSHRTRVLDHFLAGLPTIGTTGDYLSDDVIRPKKLGIVVPPNDETTLVKAIQGIFDDEMYSTICKNIAAERANLDWSKTLQPLQDFLISNPDRLERLPTAKILKINNPVVKRLKRYTPVFVKKVIIRAIRYGS